MPAKRPRISIDDSLIQRARKRIAAGQPLHHKLSPSGEISIERPLPFLWVNRTAAGRTANEASRLVRGGASFIEAPAGEPMDALILAVAETLSAEFGGVLILEIWDGPHDEKAARGSSPGPVEFRISAEPGFANSSTVRRLVSSLERVTLDQQHADVDLESRELVASPGLSPVLPRERDTKLGAMLVGLEVGPVGRDAATGEEYPLAHRNHQRQVGEALRRTAFEFSRRETRHRARHFEALGRRAFTKRVWEVDRALSAISARFDLLLVTTPVNGSSAYEEFEATRFERAPRFLYRPRVIDPPLLKRELYGIPIERVTDPTLSFLFEEKRRELDLKLTMIEELHTPRFLPTSLALYGTVDPALVAEARGLLERFPGSNARPAGEKIDASQFASRAEALLADLREKAPQITSRVVLRDDVSSLTVSDGNLLMGRNMTFSEDRAEALLQHEMGTHVVTYWNGCQQPLSLLSAGLAGYDELQEGLAVFAEYLVGGLNTVRLRTLAGRVIAAHSMCNSRSFPETFHELVDSYGFGHRAAYTNTMRVYRGGGFVKDAVYLRGLRRVVEFIQQGGRIETLLIGKVATEHAPMIEELQQREVLKELALLPTYLSDSSSRDRLARVRQGLTLEQLVS